MKTRYLNPDEARREGVDIFMASLPRGLHARILSLALGRPSTTRQRAIRVGGAQAGWHRPGIMRSCAVEGDRRVDAVRRAMGAQLDATQAESSRMQNVHRRRTWHRPRRRIGSLLNRKVLARLEMVTLDILLFSAHPRHRTTTVTGT
jgi:hypothetical protein